MLLRQSSFAMLAASEHANAIVQLHKVNLSLSLVLPTLAGYNWCESTGPL